MSKIKVQSENTKNFVKRGLLHTTLKYLTVCTQPLVQPLAIGKS